VEQAFEDLGLHHNLRRIAHVLVLAAPTASKVDARRLNPVARGFKDPQRFDLDQLPRQDEGPRSREAGVEQPSVEGLADSNQGLGGHRPLNHSGQT
jgi:hypothetical protein